MTLKMRMGMTLAMGVMASSVMAIENPTGMTVVLKDGTELPVVVDMAQSAVEVVLPGNPEAARASERVARDATIYPMVQVPGAGLTLTLRTVASAKALSDEVTYERTELAMTNVSLAPIAISHVVALQKEVPAGTMTISGNTDGSVFVEGTKFLAVEHPMARLSMETREQLTYDAAQVNAVTWDIPVVSRGGDLTVTFEYAGGPHRTDIAKVEALGTGIADEHHGYTGNVAEGNVYTLKQLPEGALTVRVTFAKETGISKPNTRGTVSLGGMAIAETVRLQAWIPIDDTLMPGQTWTYATVEGEVEEASQLRRGFHAYLNAERAHPYRVFPHYNSWYDLCINRNDAPWQKRMNVQECLDTMKTVRKELGSRGAHLDSYLWDDGWDNWDSLWDFHPGFPNGFTELAKEAKKDNAAISAWLSPCGGYGGSQAARVAYAKRQGILGPREGLMRLSQPKYYAAFRDRCVDMIERYGMNMFKFDRMGSGHDAIGAAPHHAADLRAIVQLINELRAAKQDVFINATVGTWASPFWLMWADSIWRGGDDWDALGPGPNRERWITYRDNKIYDRFVAPCPLFPLNSMMMHGIIVGEKGPPARMDRSASPASTTAFANEVWMGVACGTGLQEYYVTPHLMHPQWWDVLAEAIRWVRANEDVLRDVHWIGDDPHSGNTYNIYGYASLGEEKGIVILRNPSDKPQNIEVNLAKFLEAPEALATAKVKSLKTVYTSMPEGEPFPAVKTMDETKPLTLEPFGVRLVEVELKAPGFWSIFF